MLLAVQKKSLTDNSDFHCQDQVQHNNNIQPDQENLNTSLHLPAALYIISHTTTYFHYSLFSGYIEILAGLLNLW